MKKLLRSFVRQKELWIISLIALVWVIIFCYIPMAGNIIAFFEYYPGDNILECKFVGLKYFRDLFALPGILKVLRNTLVISSLGLTIGFITPVVFALLLNELQKKFFKRFIQTVSYMPYFVSWVVVASIMLTVLGTDGIMT